MAGNKSQVHLSPALKVSWLVAVVCLFMPAIPAAFRMDSHAMNLVADITQVQILPSGGTYHVGENIFVEVWIQDVTNLYGVDIELGFNPHQFMVLDADPILPGVQITPRSELLHPDLVLNKSADNINGTLRYTVTQLNPRPPASGSGPIFSFDIKVLAGGSGQISFTYYKLATRDAETIPADAFGASYILLKDVFFPLIVRSP